MKESNKKQFNRSLIKIFMTCFAFAGVQVNIKYRNSKTKFTKKFIGVRFMKANCFVKYWYFNSHGWRRTLIIRKK